MNDSEFLVHLCLVAYDEARAEGKLAPSERREFDHLPMKMLRGIPVFDASRMRDDQVEDAIEALERITHARRVKGVEDMVKQYMAAYGKRGVRVQDVMDSTGASKPIVLKYLRAMVADGTAVIREEKTRGKGSMRKRYFTADAFTKHLSPKEVSLTEDGDPWFARGDRPEGTHSYREAWLPRDEGTGIIHHGTWSYGCACSCPRCSHAFEEGLWAEARSEARRNGGTGFHVDLARRTERRIEREEYEAAEMIRLIAEGDKIRARRAA